MHEEKYLKETRKFTGGNMKFIMESAIDMYESLNMAIIEVGGCGYSLEDLNKMTVMDLFSALATNKIRFIAIKKETPDASKV